MQIPPPTSGAEFENIVQDALKIKWGSQDLQLIGRSGQQQHGVDIYGTDDFGQLVGIQCKKREDELTIDVVKKAVLEAEKFDPPLTKLYIATTQLLDAKLQQKVRLLSRERSTEKKFPLMVLFWDDIIKSLVINHEVLKIHYPQLATGRIGDDSGELRLFPLLDLVFYGKTLDIWANLIFGEFGHMAGVDPYSIFWYCDLIRTAAAQVLGPKETERLESALTPYEKIVRDIFSMSRHESQSEREFNQEVNQMWRQTETLARRLADDLDLLRPRLTARSLAVYELATLLARWESLENKDNRPYEKDQAGIFSDNHQTRLRDLVQKVAPNTQDLVENELRKYNTDQFSRSNVTATILSAIHDTLVLEEI